MRAKIQAQRIVIDYKQLTVQQLIQTLYIHRQLIQKITPFW